MTTCCVWTGAVVRHDAAQRMGLARLVRRGVTGLRFAKDHGRVAPLCGARAN